MIPPLSDPERDYVERLRNVLKHFHLMRAHYEEHGTYEFVDAQRFTWNYLDLKWFVDHLDDYFPARQAEAVRLHLVEDLSFHEVGARMGLGNPKAVSEYVTQALREFSPVVRGRRGGAAVRPSRLTDSQRDRLFHAEEAA